MEVTLAMHIAYDLSSDAAKAKARGVFAARLIQLHRDPRHMHPQLELRGQIRVAWPK